MMSSKAELLALRKAIKKAQPHFLRTHYGASKKISKNWRRPSGMHNKLRYGIFGKRPSVTVGYRSPSAVRGLDRKGLLPVRIHRPSDITYLDPTLHSAIIGKVGMKKKLSILAELHAKGIFVHNYKDVQKTMSALKETFAQRVAKNKTKKQIRVRAAKEREVVKPKQKEQPKTDEEKKKELDKALTQNE